MLKVNNLKVNFGGIEAVKGISFEVKEGEIVTLIGSNGAGKSTTLRTISGIVKPAEGSIDFEGTDITKVNSSDIVKMGITLCPEGRRVFPDMTVLENTAENIGFAEVKSNSVNTVYDHVEITSDMVKKDGSISLDLGANVGVPVSDMEIVVFLYDPKAVSMQLNSIEVNTED